MNNSIDKIRSLIDSVDNIVIAGHTNPDGDAVGAVLAFSTALKEKNKNVYVLLEEYAEKYNCIPNKELIYKGDYKDIKADLFISLDCGDIDRLGEAKPLFESMNSINIDHHISNTYFGKLNYVNCDASSTSEIVFGIISGWCDMNKDISACLYAGLVNDTGGFRHTSTTPLTMSIASQLIAYPFDFSGIYNSIYHSHTFVETKLMGEALMNSELICDGKFAISYISLETIKKYGGTPKDVDGVSEYLKNITGTKVSAFLYEKGENQVKASLRSEDGFDVSALVSKFGGGGHKKASGCTLESSLEDAVTTMKNAVISSFFEKGE